MRKNRHVTQITLNYNRLKKPVFFIKKQTI